jgi:TonB family protein
MCSALTFFTLFAAAVLRPISLAEPVYPPNAIAGGTVVAVLSISPGGAVKVTIVNGEGAFAESALHALRSWRFTGSAQEPILAVVNFRDPNLYSALPSGTRPTGPPPGFKLPYPKLVLDPAYPPNSLAQGTVVLKAEISSAGIVQDTEVLKGLGGMTQSAVDAVKHWRFSPARDSRGQIRSAVVYAVLVFRRPGSTVPGPLK